jgi:hypothetical protein
MRIRTVIVSSALAAAIFAGLPRRVKSETLDSGIFGVVPNQALLVKTQQRNVDELLNELATRPDPDHGVRQTLDRMRGVLDEMQNRCVKAFDPESEVPAAYPWPATDLRGVTGIGSCTDRVRFPRGFMKLMAAAPCSKDGSFRLPLAPGRYAVFLGLTPASTPELSEGAAGWWQYADIAPHQWLQLVIPKDNYGMPCTSDRDCLNGGSQCQENPRAKPSVHECLPRRRSHPPPAYHSGIKGRIGAPFTPCYGSPPTMPPPQEEQCIEAFREGSTDMAACAACRTGDGEFVLPLAPGRYILEIDQESRAVEVAPGQWSELYLQGAKPGPVKYPTCPSVP